MMQFAAYPMEYKKGRLSINFISQVQLDAAKPCRAILQKEMSALVGEIIINLQVGKIPDFEDDPEPDDSDPGIQLLKDRLGARPLN